MLIEAEFHCFGSGGIACDLVCARCRDIGASNVPYRQVIELVYGDRPYLCQDCEKVRCRLCGTYPPKDSRFDQDLCPRCLGQVMSALKAGNNWLTPSAKIGE